MSLAQPEKNKGGGQTFWQFFFQTVVAYAIKKVLICFNVRDSDFDTLRCSFKNQDLIAPYRVVQSRIMQYSRIILE